MAMFGFSVGDFITGINLIIKTIQAVEDHGRASAEYRAITGTLRQVSNVFESLVELRIDDAGQKRALEVLTRNCGQTILQFLDKIKKYDTSLGKPQTAKQWETVVRKVQWSLCSQEELRKFQAQLQADLLALQTTLQTINIKLATTHSRKTEEALARIERRSGQAKAIQLLIMQALSRCFLEFRELLLIMFAANIRIVNMLIVGLQMPLQVQYERPVYLDDPHERLIPFLRSWVHDWDDFETLLKLQFKSVPGLGKISAGEYALRDELRSKDLPRTEPLDRVFLPGRRITMSMLFDVRKFAKTCPRCFAPVQGNDTREQTCVSCQVRFSSYRIRRAEDDIAFNASLPSWSFHPLTPPDRQRQPATEGRDGAASDSHSSASALLTPEIMENFARIRTVERVGRWPRAKDIAKVKNAGGLIQPADVPDEPYVPYAPNHDTDPVLQWFRNLPGESPFIEESLYQLLEMDDDDNHEFSRSLINDWREEFILELDNMENYWEQKRYDQLCMRGELLGGNCMAIGILGPRDTLMDLYYCYSENGQYVDFDEARLCKVEDLMKRVKREFKGCCNTIVQAWNVSNWSNREKNEKA